MDTNTHEIRVSFVVAKLLKKAGFDWDVEFFYDKDGNLQKFVYPSNANNKNFINEQFSAPSLDVAKRWLREERALVVNVTTFLVPDITYRWQLRCVDMQHMDVLDVRYFDDYYEATEEGILKCLNIIEER